MAKKEIVYVSLLPDHRAVRFVRMDSERMLDMMERVGAVLPPVKPGEQAAVDGRVQAKISKHTQMATIAMCLRGITLQPVPLVMKKRPPNEEQIANAKAAGVPVPESVEDGVDVDATLRPFNDNPKDPRWTPIGEMQLENFDDENELSMFRLFGDPGAWKAVIARIGSAGGGTGADPFVGKLLKTSSG